ncbi:MAG: GNAT family N-acetyltransferase [Ferruginibacter sp.]
MKEQLQFKTERLFIEPLTLNDAGFIVELLNTEGWIKFIGDRHIQSNHDAITYIQKILENNDISYWKVKLKSNEVSIGIISFIKREYLAHHDIGFAFLPKFLNNGYAYEATKEVLNNLIRLYNPSQILATTVAENVSSIKLLNKLGLSFQKEMKIEFASIHVYGMSVDKLT